MWLLLYDFAIIERRRQKRIIRVPRYRECSRGEQQQERDRRPKTEMKWNLIESNADWAMAYAWVLLLGHGLLLLDMHMAWDAHYHYLMLHTAWPL